MNINETRGCSWFVLSYFGWFSHCSANQNEVSLGDRERVSKGMFECRNFKKMVSAFRTLIALIQPCKFPNFVLNHSCASRRFSETWKNPLSIFNYKRKLSLTSFWLGLIYQGIAKMGLHCVGGIWKSNTKFLRLILPSILIRHVNVDPGSDGFRRRSVIHSELQMLLLELKLKTSK